jgi:oxygen-dependent protoporphyrinogen oxidase
VSLAYRRADVAHPLDASGVVVTEAGRTSLRACTFSSTKFAGRAPEGWCLVRAFFDLSAAGDRDDAGWADAAHQALHPMLGLSSAAAHAWVARWPDTLPRGRAGELAAARAKALADRAGAADGLEPAWAGVDGIGVDGAVRAGLDAARRLDGSREHSIA